MTDPIQIRMGGYGPADHRLLARAQIHRRPARRRSSATGSTSNTSGTSWISAIGPRTSCGWSSTALLTLGYQSSSYLTDRVPELGFVDLPFLFASNEQARGAMDGALGADAGAQDRGAR